MVSDRPGHILPVWWLGESLQGVLYGGTRDSPEINLMRLIRGDKQLHQSHGAAPFRGRRWKDSTPFVPLGPTRGEERRYYGSAENGISLLYSGPGHHAALTNRRRKAKFGQTERNGYVRVATERGRGGGVSLSSGSPAGSSVMTRDFQQASTSQTRTEPCLGARGRDKDGQGIFPLLQRSIQRQGGTGGEAPTGPGVRQRVRDVKVNERAQVPGLPRGKAGPSGMFLRLGRPGWGIVSRFVLVVFRAVPPAAD